MNLIDLVAKYNGWNMALTGIAIVFASLIIVALVISRIHVLMGMWENKGALKKRLASLFKAEEKAPAADKAQAAIPAPLKESARTFQVFSGFLGEQFKLADLIRFAEKRGMTTPCPKLTIDALLKAKLIIKGENNLFCWDKTICDSNL